MCSKSYRICIFIIYSEKIIYRLSNGCDYMNQDGTLLLDNELNIDETTNHDKLKETISMLQGTIKRQNQMILEFKNNYIRLENNIKLFESKVEYYSTYKKLCEIILDKTNKNPISAMWFLRSVRKKIEEFKKQH